MDQAESRWMLAVKSCRNPACATYGAWCPAANNDRPAHLSAPFYQSNSPGILTLLFSCIATA